MLSLPREDLRDGVADGNASLLDLLLGQACGYAHLEGRQGRVDLGLGPRGASRQGFHARNEHVLCEAL